MVLFLFSCYFPQCVSIFISIQIQSIMVEKLQNLNCLSCSVVFSQLLEDVRRWNREPRGGLAEGSNPDLWRSPNGADARPIRPHTYIGAESKTRVSREGKKTLKEGLMRTNKVTEEVREDDSEADINSPHSQSGVKLLSGSEPNKGVVNVIPLPPRKPTNHIQSVSPAVAHRSLASEDKGAVGVRSAGGLSSNTPQSPAEHLEKMEHGQEGRTRRVSEDRPKLDKSHSTPAYDMEGDIGQGSLSAPLAPVKPSSPSRHSPAPTTTSASAQVTLGKSKPSEPSSSKKCLGIVYLCSF